MFSMSLGRNFRHSDYFLNEQALLIHQATFWNLKHHFFLKDQIMAGVPSAASTERTKKLEGLPQEN